MKNLIVKLKLTVTVSHQVQLLTPTIACMLSLVCAYIHTCIHIYIQSILVNVHVYVYIQEDICMHACVYVSARGREREGNKSTNISVNRCK